MHKSTAHGSFLLLRYLTFMPQDVFLTQVGRKVINAGLVNRQVCTLYWNTLELDRPWTTI